VAQRSGNVQAVGGEDRGTALSVEPKAMEEGEGGGRLGTAMLMTALEDDPYSW